MERVLLDMDVIAEVAVVGISGGVLGEQVAAWVVIDDKAAGQQSESDVLAAVKTYAREHLANYKTPKHIWAIDQLPRNPSGKILKKVLREKSLELDPSVDAEQTPLRATVTPQLREKLAAAYPSEAHRVTQTYLQNVIQSISGNDTPPAIDDGLLDVGLDSLMLVELSHQLQAEVGAAADISAASVFDYPRVIDLAAFLVSTIQETDDARVAVTTGPHAAKFSAAQANIEQGISAVNRGATEIAQMTEEEVLEELMRELEE